MEAEDDEATRTALAVMTIWTDETDACTYLLADVLSQLQNMSNARLLIGFVNLSDCLLTMIHIEMGRHPRETLQRVALLQQYQAEE